MKTTFSVLVVLICLIASNFVFAQSANNDVQEASVYWNFTVLDQITTQGGSAEGNYNLVSGTTLTPPSGYNCDVGDNTISTGFSGSDGYNTQWTVTSGATTYTSYINSGTDANTGALSNGTNIFFKITAEAKFGVTDPGFAYCNIIIDHITSNASLNGSSTYTWTITCDYSL